VAVTVQLPGTLFTVITPVVVFTVQPVDAPRLYEIAPVPEPPVFVIVPVDP
jgi:hypothetical protein